jgi:HSP20 family protein
MQRNAAPVRWHRLPLSAEASDACRLGTEADWMPAVDIVEDEERFVLHADLAGVDPEKIEINAEKGTLTLSGERAVEASHKADGMRRVERVSGKFLRKFSLPDTADADTIVASSKNGTLEIVIPKHEPESRRITVEAV